MKTEIEPITKSISPDGSKAGGGLPLALWLVALIFVVGSFVAYQKVSSRRIDPPPPPVNVKSISQVNQTIFRFIDFMIKDNWDEAQKMLSAEAQKKLADSHQTLKDSLLASHKGKDQKVINGGPTQEDPELGENSVRHNCTLYFDKGETMVVPLTIVKETVNNVDRLAISDWGTAEKPKSSPSPTATQ